MSRSSDADAIRTVLLAYEAGTRARDVEALRALFHPHAVMSGWLGPTLLVGGLEPFYDFLAKNEVADDYTSEIVGIDVTGAVASTKVVEENLFGMSFVNYFHLARDGDGTWVITSKLFHHDAP